MGTSPSPPASFDPAAKPLIKRRTPPSGWRRWIPGLAANGQFRITWLRHDIGAGLALSAVLLPVGIAYGVAAATRSRTWSRV
jgi:hypothetical protein